MQYHVVENALLYTAFYAIWYPIIFFICVQDPQIRSKYSREEFNSVEAKIEREYVETLQVRCYREKQYSKFVHGFPVID